MITTVSGARSIRQVPIHRTDPRRAPSTNPSESVCALHPEPKKTEFAVPVLGSSGIQKPNRRGFSNKFFSDQKPTRFDIRGMGNASFQKSLNGCMADLSSDFPLAHLERLIDHAHEFYRCVSDLVGGARSRKAVKKRTKSHTLTSQCFQMAHKRIHGSTRPQ